MDVEHSIIPPPVHIKLSCPVAVAAYKDVYIYSC